MSTSLRPSNLPKLAVCPCYESHPNAGSAAARGSSLDTIFRARMAGDPAPLDLVHPPTEDDLAAVEWAVTMITALSSGTAILTREDECRVAVPGFDHIGTADAIIPERLAHADLKTGQKRNYREQMAAYALGLMEQHFASEWTAHLLFCDQREVVTHRFTFEEAHQIVATVVSAWSNPDKQPTICDYCNWCAKADTCSARLTLAAQAVSTTEPAFNFETVLADNNNLGRFLTACHVLDAFREKAETAAKQRLQAGATIPGWKLTSRRGSQFIRHEDVATCVERFGLNQVLASYGSMSASKLRELWERSTDVPFPEELIKHGPATVSLRAASTQLSTQPKTK
jgi:hypothetical protein